MIQVANYDELMRAVAEVKRQGNSYTTSFFASPAQVEAWAGAGMLYAMRSEGALLVLRRDDELLRVHHIASTPLTLRDALAALVASRPYGPLVADTVGKPEDMHAVLEAYRDSGFRDHAKLDRMQHHGPLPCTAVMAPNVAVACEEDVAPIHAFMNRWLDPLSEQIQTPTELAAAVAAGKALVIRDDNALAGFLIFETTGMSSVLRYWHVEPSQRGRGVGAQLMHAFMSHCVGSRRIALWVLSDNAGAITKYRHYGFRHDGVIDQIMTWQT